MYTEITKCRICKNSGLINIINLGQHANASVFPHTTTEELSTVPLEVVKCNCCGLVQLKHEIHATEFYLQQYGYRSGINNTMIQHLEQLVLEIENKVTIKENDIILDIGSNDCTLLKSYKLKNTRRIGIDPTGNQFKQYYPEDVMLVSDFFSKTIFESKFCNEKAKVVTSISMFYDLPDPLDFMEQIFSILSDDGIWIAEQGYVNTMLKVNSIDTVCHEHLEYYALKQMKWMADKVGFHIVDVTLNDCNGGSFRTTFRKTEPTIEQKLKVAAFEETEKEAKLDELQTYLDFSKRCEKIKEQTMKFLRLQHASGKRIYLYGASTKGNTLLQYYDLDNKLIKAAADRNVEKFGRYTPKTKIPIIPETDMREEHPEFLFVLPWHFKNVFLKRESEYLDKGGQYIFPLPTFEIVRKKKCALITGITGELGSYLADLLLSKDYIVYGQTRKYDPSKMREEVFPIECQLTELVDIIPSILPDEIYHLAGETDIPTSIEQPEETLFVNGNVVQILCHAIADIKTKNIKLFIANSTSIYGGIGGVIDEQTWCHYPTNPYSIGKSMAYWIAKYYRETKGIYCVNGIIFKILSPKQNKIRETKHILNALASKELIVVTRLNNIKDWIHAYDAAQAIYLTMQQPTSSEYVIGCNMIKSTKDYINEISDQLKLNLKWQTDGINEYAVDENEEIKVKTNNKSDITISKLVGNYTKITELGWKPEFDFKDIVTDLITHMK